MRPHRIPMVHRLLAASLPCRVSCRNTLYDDCAAIDGECFRPSQLPLVEFDPNFVLIPLDALFFRRQAWSGVREESNVAAAGASGERVGGGCVGRNEVD